MKKHTDLKVGDRITEGSGKNRKTWRVNEIERFPQSMCRGTHVNGPNEWRVCYTGLVNAR